MAGTEQFATTMLKKLFRDRVWTGKARNAKARHSELPPTAWNFTYFGQSAEREALPMPPHSFNKVAIPKSFTFPLSQAQPGDRLQISALRGDRAMLRQQGLRLGASLDVVSRQTSGSVVIRVGSVQVGLSGATTPQVMVKRIILSDGAVSAENK